MTSATSTSILLPDERIVMTSDRNTIVLANYRIRYSSGSGSVERFLSITLDAIASCGVVTKTQPLLLMFGALSTIGGLAQHDDSIRGILIVFGILLLLAYAFTRSAMLTISSKGGQHIAVPAKGIGREGIVDFINAVDEAKIALAAAMRKTWKAAS